MEQSGENSQKPLFWTQIALLETDSSFFVLSKARLMQKIKEIQGLVFEKQAQFEVDPPIVHMY